MVADWRLTLHFIWATNSATACAVTENTHRNQLWNLPLNLTVFVLNEVKLCWFMWSSLSSLLLACCFQIFVSERKKAISGTTGFPAHYREFRIDSWIGICVHTCVFLRCAHSESQHPQLSSYSCEIYLHSTVDYPQILFSDGTNGNDHFHWKQRWTKLSCMMDKTLKEPVIKPTGERIVWLTEN